MMTTMEDVATGNTSKVRGSVVLWTTVVALVGIVLINIPYPLRINSHTYYDPWFLLTIPLGLVFICYGVGVMRRELKPLHAHLKREVPQTEVAMALILGLVMGLNFAYHGLSEKYALVISWVLVAVFACIAIVQNVQTYRAYRHADTN